MEQTDYLDRLFERTFSRLLSEDFLRVLENVEATKRWQLRPNGASNLWRNWQALEKGVLYKTNRDIRKIAPIIYWEHINIQLEMVGQI